MIARLLWRPLGLLAHKPPPIPSVIEPGHPVSVGQARVHGLEHRAKLDGYVDPWEAARIRAAQNWQSVRIFVKKHY